MLTRTRESLDLSCENAVESFLIDNSSLEAVIVCSAKVGGIAANTTDQVGFLLENLRIQNSIFRGVLNSDIEKLLFLGSSCIYPKMASQPIIEEYLLTGPLENTNEGYAIAKIAGLKLCKYVSAEVNGKDFRAVMPTNVYGSNDNFDPVSGHVIGAMISKFVEDKEKEKDEKNNRTSSKSEPRTEVTKTKKTDKIISKKPKGNEKEKMVDRTKRKGKKKDSSSSSDNKDGKDDQSKSNKSQSTEK